MSLNFLNVKIKIKFLNKLAILEKTMNKICVKSVMNFINSSSSLRYVLPTKNNCEVKGKWVIKDVQRTIETGVQI